MPGMYRGRVDSLQEGSSVNCLAPFCKLNTLTQELPASALGPERTLGAWVITTRVRAWAGIIVVAILIHFSAWADISFPATWLGGIACAVASVNSTWIVTAGCVWGARWSKGSPAAQIISRTTLVTHGISCGTRVVAAGFTVRAWRCICSIQRPNILHCQWSSTAWNMIWTAIVALWALERARVIATGRVFSTSWVM
jgi:hypothetical protein